MAKSANRVVCLLIVGALVLFAANSVVCKLALGKRAIDPASFTAIRLISGAATLFLLLKVSGLEKKTFAKGSWLSAGMLFLYAVCFSYAYMTMEAGTGTLILFGTVQLTMIASAIASGERPRLKAWAGWVAAFSGLISLVLPGIASPAPVGSCLMIAAGISWGVYSIKGKGGQHPLAETKSNFVRSLAFVGFLLLPICLERRITPLGLYLAVISGAIASGVGYALWYGAIRQINTVQAGVVQLLVPVLATLGGILFLEEQVTLRLLVSTIVIFGGVYLSLTGQNRDALSNKSSHFQNVTTRNI